MGEAHELVLLRLQRALEFSLRDGLAEVRPELVDRRAIRAQAGRGGEIRRDICNRDNASATPGPKHCISWPTGHYAPVGEAVAEVAAVEQEGIFTRFDEVRRDLSRRVGRSGKWRQCPPSSCRTSTHLVPAKGTGACDEEGLAGGREHDVSVNACS